MRQINTLKQLMAIAALSISLVGCDHIPVGYDIQVEQGNIIHQESVSQLRVGMTRVEVVDIMGEPVMVNSFDTRAWHYVYTRCSRKNSLVKNKLTLIFEGDRLAKILH